MTTDFFLRKWDGTGILHCHGRILVHTLKEAISSAFETHLWKWVHCCVLACHNSEFTNGTVHVQLFLCWCPFNIMLVISCFPLRDSKHDYSLSRENDLVIKTSSVPQQLSAGLNNRRGGRDRGREERREGKREGEGRGRLTASLREKDKELHVFSISSCLSAPSLHLCPGSLQWWNIKCKQK